MNDIFADSFSRFHSEDEHPPHSHVIEMTPNNSSVYLDKFFEDVEAIKDELRDLDSSTTTSNPPMTNPKPPSLQNGLPRLLISQKAKFIKVRLEVLDLSNAANRSLPGCGSGKSSVRTRTFVNNGLRKKLQDSMNSFNDLCQRMATEYRDTVQCHYFTVTGENADESTVDSLIATGGSETFLQNSGAGQGASDGYDHGDPGEASSFVRGGTQHR